jgi:hypothetical protein
MFSVEEFLKKQQYCSFSSIALRENFIKLYPIVGQDFERSFGAADWALFFQISTKHPIYFINKPITQYRRHSQNVSGNPEVDIKNLMLVFLHIRLSNN